MISCGWLSRCLCFSGSVNLSCNKLQKAVISLSWSVYGIFHAFSFPFSMFLLGFIHSCVVVFCWVFIGLFVSNWSFLLSRSAGARRVASQEASTTTASTGFPDRPMSSPDLSMGHILLAKIADKSWNANTKDIEGQWQCQLDSQTDWCIHYAWVFLMIREA